MCMSSMVPVQANGFDDVLKRIKMQDEQCNAHRVRVEVAFYLSQVLALS